MSTESFPESLGRSGARHRRKTIAVWGAVVTLAARIRRQGSGWELAGTTSPRSGGPDQGALWGYTRIR